MITFVVVIHIMACIILILMVLLQSGEAADLAGAFGGGGSKTAFGPRGATSFLSRLTTATAIIFMITSLALAILYTRSEKPIITEETIQQETTVPAQEGEKEEEQKAAPTGETEEEEKAEEGSEQNQ